MAAAFDAISDGAVGWLTRWGVIRSDLEQSLRERRGGTTQSQRTRFSPLCGMCAKTMSKGTTRGGDRKEDGVLCVQGVKREDPTRRQFYQITRKYQIGPIVGGGGIVDGRVSWRGIGKAEGAEGQGSTAEPRGTAAGLVRAKRPRRCRATETFKRKLADDVKSIPQRLGMSWSRAVHQLGHWRNFDPLGHSLSSSSMTLSQSDVSMAGTGSAPGLHRRCRRPRKVTFAVTTEPSIRVESLIDESQFFGDRTSAGDATRSELCHTALRECDSVEETLR